MILFQAFLYCSWMLIKAEKFFIISVSHSFIHILKLYSDCYYTAKDVSWTSGKCLIVTQSPTLLLPLHGTLFWKDFVQWSMGREKFFFESCLNSEVCLK